LSQKCSQINVFLQFFQEPKLRNILQFFTRYQPKPNRVAVSETCCSNNEL